MSLLEAIGGAARGKVTVLLALVLGLQCADTATIGAVGAELERGLRIGNTELGLLAFLTMLSALLLSGLVMVRARRSYPRDVATALASERGAG